MIIAELRANEGRVGGMWEGTPLLLLHHTGANSGVSRVNPITYLPDGSRYLIWASNGVADLDQQLGRMIIARRRVRPA